jgi:hypothetical protein
MRAPLFTFKQNKKKKKRKKQKQKQKQVVPRADKKIPVGCQIFRRIRRTEKHILIGVVERMSQRKTNGLKICRRSIKWLL